MNFQRILGIAISIWWGIPVFNPALTVSYRRSHVPVSSAQKVLNAAGAIALCLAAFGIRPLLCAGGTAACVAAGMLVKKRDFRQYEKQTGRWVFTPTNRRPMWVSALVLDAVFLSLFAVALIRDSLQPPVNEDQKILHYVSWGWVALLLMAGAVLLWDRPRKEAPRKEG